MPQGFGFKTVGTMMRTNTNPVKTALLVSLWALAGTPSTHAAPAPGITPVSDTEVTLCLEAPGKTKVNAVGDFNDWTPSAGNLMTKEGDKFWITIGNLVQGKEYIFQYWVDDGIKIGDPYSRKVVDFHWDKQIITEGTYPGLIAYNREFDGMATVFKAGLPAPVAAPKPFVKQPPENLIIYETLIRDFTRTHSFKEMKDSLPYFKRLGVNAIQLMPVMEFDDNFGWGYNPAYPMAVDKFYGPAEDLKALVAAAHEQGIAILLDLVLNHAMGQHPLIKLWWDKAANKPSMDSPFANQIAKHEYNVGFDLNYESAFTRDYYKAVLQHWIREFKVDGYRIDLSKGLTQKNTLGDVTAWGRFDQSRVDILMDLAAAARAADPDVYFILEHFGDNEEEKFLASKGFILWGNSSFDHGFAEEGRVATNFNWAYYKSRGWADNRLVTYMESHDEHRLVARAVENGLSSGDYNVKDIKTGLERAKMSALFLFGIPGAKQMWQYGEWGDSRPRGVTAAERMGGKPLTDEYRGDASRVRLWNSYASLLHFRQRFQAAFNGGTFSWKPDGAVRNWKLNHADLNAYAVGNFGLTPAMASLNLTGTWYSYFSREKFTFNGPVDHQLRPGEFHLLVDRAVFANKENLTDFTVPKAWNPEPVTVGIAGRAKAGTVAAGRVVQRNGKFRPVIVGTDGTAKDVSGRIDRAPLK
jgi:glycosidase